MVAEGGDSLGDVAGCGGRRPAQWRAAAEGRGRVRRAPGGTDWAVGGHERAVAADGRAWTRWAVMEWVTAQGGGGGCGESMARW
jgi:hypothetical protein